MGAEDAAPDVFVYRDAGIVPVQGKKRGSRMEFSLEHLQPKERASFALRSLYETAGCRKYHMGRFEEYSLYQENRSFCRRSRSSPLPTSMAVCWHSSRM